MRINPTSTKIATISGLLALSYFAIQGIVRDYNNAEKIKNELLEHPYKKINEYAPMIRVKEAETSEPFFNKTGYWKVEADRIKKELDERNNGYISIRKHYSRANSVYELSVLLFAESGELKSFLNNQNNKKQKMLEENPNMKLVTSKNFQLDETFPTIDVYELEHIINNDSKWIPQKFAGYKIKKEKIKVGKKIKIKTVKNSIYEPAYRNTAAFFEKTIKINKKGKYITCNYYAEIPDSI